MNIVELDRLYVDRVCRCGAGSEIWSIFCFTLDGRLITRTQSDMYNLNIHKTIL